MGQLPTWTDCSPEINVARMPWPTRTVPAVCLRRLCRERRIACLTYDDGPSKELSREVMGVLGASDVRATFFVLGNRATAAGDVLDEAIAAGHEIACHTSSHLNAWKAGCRAVEDVQQGYVELSKWVPADGMFRPPYGRMSIGTMREVRRRGAPVGWWTIDSGDTHEILPRPETAAEAIARDGGGVVLLHDFDRESRDADERRGFVIRATELLLDAAAREGIIVARLGEILGLSKAHPTIGSPVAIER